MQRLKIITGILVIYAILGGIQAAYEVMLILK